MSDQILLTTTVGSFGWYVSWCNYMTRVGDGLQLPLESTNVFAPAPPKK